VAAPSTSLLFLFRIRAVFNRQRVVVVSSAILWLATLGGSIALPFALTGGNIGGTDRCIDTSVKSFSSAAIIAITCYDTFVFIAISWNTIMRATVEGKLKSFFDGRELPYISRELLQGGQHYYLLVRSWLLATSLLIREDPVHQDHRRSQRHHNGNDTLTDPIGRPYHGRRAQLGAPELDGVSGIPKPQAPPNPSRPLHLRRR
jgi:hypothetical protein